MIVTPSLGIALYPTEGESYEALSMCADAAMYRAKQSGRQTFRFFTREMQERSERTLQLENALRHGEGRALEVVLAGRRLEVRDRGPGFGADDPMRSFERFRRGGGKPGHGLGLALVQHICTACGWTVRAANRADGGACLTLDFGAGSVPGSGSSSASV